VNASDLVGYRLHMQHKSFSIWQVSGRMLPTEAHCPEVELWQ